MTDTQTIQAMADALRAVVRGDVYFDDARRGIYSTDASNYQIQPVGVVVPRDEDDVCAAVRIAREHKVSILARGGGTSLAGQAVGASLVIDFSRFMNRVLEVNVEARWARVQPGVVRDELNAEVAAHGLHFAPDPATANRATVGGMIANNSSGTRSIIYGKTVDHLIDARILLADGTVATFGELSPDAYARGCEGDGREAELLTGIRKLVEENREEIEKRYPKVMRRVSGYSLDEFVHTDTWNLAKLIAGSEGTLAVLLEARVNLEPLPAHQCLCVPHFATIADAIRAVSAALPHGPSAVEILDHAVITLARRNLMTAPLCDFIEQDPQAILIIEFCGDTAEEATRKATEAAATLSAHEAFICPVIADAASQAKAWDVRKNGLGLMLGMKGDRKPLPFIEDAGIPVPHLPEYIERVVALCRELDVDVAMYAHASVGVIHVRPLLDLRQAKDIELMKTIANQTFELVVEYGGSWSGEHGDGLVRSPFLERYFGSQLYGAFRELKTLFDPQGLMNPGKIVDAAPMDQDLRYGTDYRAMDPPTVFQYREDGSFSAAVEMCSGVGACRKRLSGTMCPSYMVTGKEHDSTRGRANALRLAMTGQLGLDALTGAEMRDIFDLCISCKACKSECPSNVDMAKLKSEFLQMVYDRHGTSRRDRMVRNSARTSARMAGLPARLVNRVQRAGWFRRILERTAGFSSRRTLPEFAAEPFLTWYARNPSPVADGRPEVALFVDTYMNYHEPRIGRAAVELLRSCGYQVLPVSAGCCQRPRLSHGFLRLAREDGAATMRNLDQHVRQNRPVVVCEPSCASALTDDLPDLIEDPELGKRLAGKIMMIDVFLARELESGALTGSFTPLVERILIHGHCHQKALYGTTAMKMILSRAPNVEVAEVDSGCCGMAGSFGYEIEHYEISQRMGERRLFPAVRECAPGTRVVACGFSCRHQIEHGTGIKPLHWVETIRGGVEV